MPRITRLFLVVLLFAAVAASAQTTYEDPTLWDHYYAAVRDAAVYNPLNLRVLKPLVPDSNGDVTVSTLKGYAYALGPMQTTSDIWVSIVPEVQDKCMTYGGDVNMRVRQLLGLPPYSQSSYNTFNTIRVQASSVFRPSPDPETGTRMPCPAFTGANLTAATPVFAPNCGNFFPAGTGDYYVNWVANNSLWSYQVPVGAPSGANPTVGFPWTRLGYTYDWWKASDHYGASEYIIPAGTAVTVTATQDLASYCKPKP